MDDEIQLISDGDGLAIIGDPAAVERFLHSEGLPSKDLGLHRLGTALRTGSGALNAGSTIAASAGRWVKLTDDSVQKINKFGLMKGSSSHLSRGVVQAKGGQIQGIVEFAKGPGALLTNPAILAGAAGIMAQLAMQQSMDEITDYLATIDRKVDDILRSQKDAVFADMIAVGFVIDEALTLRDHMGRVSEVTWSKVQATSLTIARTQAYTLRQLDALAEKLEQKKNLGELAKTSKEAESTVQEWLAVLARCFQLQDAFTVLELDRVLDASPDELNNHRIALRAARQNRLELIAHSTEHLMARMDAAASKANTKVLMHPVDARVVVEASNRVATGVVVFHERLGIEDARQSVDAKRWRDAATDVRDDVFETSADGIDAAKRFGNETFHRARSMTDKVAIKLAEQAIRRRGDNAGTDKNIEQ